MLERIPRARYEERARLVIVDPLMAALSGDVNGNQDQDVRRVLAEMVLKIPSEKLRVITPQFLDDKGDGPRMVSFFAKKARGSMARYIVQRRLTDPEGGEITATEGITATGEITARSRWSGRSRCSSSRARSSSAPSGRSTCGPTAWICAGVASPPGGMGLVVALMRASAREAASNALAVVLTEYWG